MEGLAKAFEHAHGFRFKLSFAETLVHLLHPVAKVLFRLYFHYLCQLTMIDRPRKQKLTILSGPRPSKSYTRRLKSYQGKFDTGMWHILWSLSAFACLRRTTSCETGWLVLRLASTS
jgi:hypothetical protein